MQAGDVGVAIDVPATISLQGADSVLLVLISPTNVRTSLTMSIGTTTLTNSSGNTVAAPYYWATRNSLNTDLPIEGEYEAQLVADFGSGTVNEASDKFTITVGARL